jgi:hypothetical protein
MKLDELVRDADPRSIEWLATHWHDLDGALSTDSGVGMMIRFFEGELDLIAAVYGKKTP